MSHSKLFARITMAAVAMLEPTLTADRGRSLLAVALVGLAALSFSGHAATQSRLPESPADSAAPLPDKLPGGQIVTTDGVLELSHRSIPVHFIDVSGETKTLPKTISAPWLVQPTNPNSDTLGQLDDFLYRVTGHNKHAPVTFFGSGPQSRGAYDSALRAVKLGYRGVRWYRGGIEAWRRDGQHLMPARLILPSDRPVWGYGSRDIEAPSVPTSSSFDELTYLERESMGVPAPAELRGAPLQGATPNKIPGGQLVTTRQLVQMLKKPAPVILVDALGADQTLPKATGAAWAGQPGRFDDETQQKLADQLRLLTHDDKSATLVFYCGGPQSWMSYNAALRAINLGYRKVLWYRGGVQYWYYAGMTFEPAVRPAQIQR